MTAVDARHHEQRDRSIFGWLFPLFLRLEAQGWPRRYPPRLASSTRATPCMKPVVREDIMKQLMSVVIAASGLALPTVSFAAQANGPRALDRVVQQNEQYERDHLRQSPAANGERKAADQSIVEPTCNGDAR